MPNISKNHIFVAILAVIVIFCSVPVAVISAVTDETYRHNLQIYSSQPTDEAALEFYKLPSYDRNIKSRDEEIIALADSVTENIQGDYAKAKAVHGWVSDNIYYDYDALNGGTDENVSASAVLETKRSVCAGYAYLTVALLRAAGIPAKYISGGISDSDESHAWCEAFADGRWVIIDAACDSGNRYENGGEEKSPGTDKYFDISLEDFSLTHKYKDYSFDFRIFDLSGVMVAAIPDGITDIGDGAFRGSNLTGIIIPDGVTGIGEKAFENCASLESITIPDSVTSIGRQAFAGCVNLTGLTIPKSVTYIDAALFETDDTDKMDETGDTGDTETYLNGEEYDGSDIPGITDTAQPGLIPAANIPKNLTIYGEAGSYAEEFAASNGINFKAVDFSEFETVEISENPEFPLYAGIFDTEGASDLSGWLLMIIILSAALVSFGIVAAKKFVKGR